MAVNKVKDFIDQIEGLRPHQLSHADADLLVAYANNLIALQFDQ